MPNWHLPIAHLDSTGPPALVPIRSLEKVGQFRVDLSGAAPQQTTEGSNQMDVPSVVFLFKFEVVDTQDVFFNWTVRMQSLNCY